MSQSLFTGFFSGLTLIVAVGAQNTFVLRQGLRREHIFWICLFCACSDALMIAAGVFGLNAFVQSVPGFETLMRFGGAAFLIAYGGKSLFRAWVGGQSMKADDARSAGSLLRVLVACAALTWLNPHLYLDTMVLLGSIASNSASPTLFVVGASAASFVFFFALGYGARLLAPAFERPKTWRLLDAFVGLTMLFVAAALLVG